MQTGIFYPIKIWKVKATNVIYKSEVKKAWKINGKKRAN